MEIELKELSSLEATNFINNLFGRNGKGMKYSVVFLLLLPLWVEIVHRMFGMPKRTIRKIISHFNRMFESERQTLVPLYRMENRIFEQRYGFWFKGCRSFSITSFQDA